MDRTSLNKRIIRGNKVYKLCCIAGVVFLASVGVSQAGFREWSVDKEADLFSGGDSVSVGFMTSFRSGVMLLCDSAKEGLTIRSIPGFTFDARLEAFKPTLKFAFDGKFLFDAEGEVGAVGDNLAISQTQIKGEQAKEFVKAFAAAKKQIAISDGISDKPQLLTARGSTTAGPAIVSCIDKQQSK